MESAPSNALSTTSGSPCEPATTSTRAIVSLESASGLRAITRTGSLPRITFSRTCLPIWPVGVVTTIIVGSVPSLYPAVNDPFSHGHCPAVHDGNPATFVSLPLPMTPVESRRLRYFVAVAEELSFVRASQRLHIAPPALSRAISELEAHLGVKLFDRSSRHVALTEAGSALLPDVRRALQDLDAATSRIQRLGRRPAWRMGRTTRAVATRTRRRRTALRALRPGRACLRTPHRGAANGRTADRTSSRRSRCRLALTARGGVRTDSRSLRLASPHSRRRRHVAANPRHLSPASTRGARRDHRHASRIRRSPLPARADQIPPSGRTCPRAPIRR